jgi:chromosome partitioning protein
MIICVGGIKGGNGKSTMAVHLVIWLTMAGFDVLLVDADRQRTSTKFTTARHQNYQGKDKYMAIQLPSESIFKQLGKLKDQYQVIVVDAGEGENPALRAALLAADYFIIPVQPKNFDFWAVAKELRDMLFQIETIRPGIPLRCFAFLNLAAPYMNPKDKRGDRNREVAANLAMMENIEYIPHIIVRRDVFDVACGQGFSVQEVKEKEVSGANRAKKEINLLFSEILKRIKYAEQQTNLITSGTGNE